MSVISRYFFNYHLWLGLGRRPGKGGAGESAGTGRLGEPGVVVDKVNVRRWHSVWQKSAWLFL